MKKYLKKVFQSITKKEIIFVLAVWAVVFLITLMPIVYANFLAGTEKVFTGMTTFAGPDKMLYLSQIEQARQGKLLFSNLYNTDFGSHEIFSPLRLSMGWLGKITGLSNLAVFQLFRILFSLVFLTLVYLFISRIFIQVKWRKICLLMLCFSSGLGILTAFTLKSAEAVMKNGSTDLWVSESNTFLSLSHSPLFIFSQIVILFSFWWLVARIKKAKLTEVIGISLLLLLLGLVHPFDLAIIFSVAGVYCLFNIIKKNYHWPEALKLALIAAISFQSITYFLLLKSYSPGFYQWLQHNFCLSPRLLNFIIGYGLILIFYIIGLWLNRRTKNAYVQLLIIWSVIGWLLIYLPFN